MEQTFKRYLYVNAQLAKALRCRAVRGRAGASRPAPLPGAPRAAAAAPPRTCGASASPPELHPKPRHGAGTPQPTTSRRKTLTNTAALHSPGAGSTFPGKRYLPAPCRCSSTERIYSQIQIPPNVLKWV